MDDFCCEKPSEKPHERTKRLTIKRVIATYMNASPVWGTLTQRLGRLTISAVQPKTFSTQSLPFSLPS
jgi:hypothetical protein